MPGLERGFPLALAARVARRVGRALGQPERGRATFNHVVRSGAIVTVA